ncbi:hypothetical protein NUW58_g6145 [Xylaria curta]|uniref:Uncharacterized protein n=1 Tax=Xylaria curta TaxID=42375 RepID=A0ACC1NYP8_9PEZI|nr:hypothetical protein NUW58_g6145 [Xylaria curta]
MLRRLNGIWAPIYASGPAVEEAPEHEVITTDATNKEILQASDGRPLFYSAAPAGPTTSLQSSPEHYRQPVRAGGAPSPAPPSESIENWGPGPLTYFKGIPEPQPDFIPALPEFPAAYRSALALQLADGTVFAHTLTAFRDLPGGYGVEIFQGIWIPENSPREVLEGLRAHITVEFSNWLKLAYKKAIAAL